MVPVENLYFSFGGELLFGESFSPFVDDVDVSVFGTDGAIRRVVAPAKHRSF
jgi:hypothetical protein